jgi:hypothetical protein
MAAPMSCPHCGADLSAGELFHSIHCDGQQGKVEAVYSRQEFEADRFALSGREDVPMLMSGLVPETLDTSAAAAGSVIDTKAAQRAEVEEVIVGARAAGQTDDAVQAALDIDGNSERPRRWELWKLGRITLLRDADGNPIKRRTRSGRLAVVWVAVEFAA